MLLPAAATPGGPAARRPAGPSSYVSVCGQASMLQGQKSGRGERGPDPLASRASTPAGAALIEVLIENWS